MFHVIANANSIVRHAIHIKIQIYLKNGIIKHVNVSKKIIVRAKKNMVYRLSHCMYL